MAPLLLGEACAADGPARAALLQNQYLGFSGTGVEMRAASAVDIALWDLYGQATGQPLHQCLGGLSHERVRIYNTCAGYRYIRAASGQKTGNWGVEAGGGEGPYEDLDAFLHRADELAHSLLEQGVTAMEDLALRLRRRGVGGPLDLPRRTRPRARAVPQDPRRGRQ